MPTGPYGWFSYSPEKVEAGASAAPEPTGVMAATAPTLTKLLAGFTWFGRIVSMV
jgi:hypothetical protein